MDIAYIQAVVDGIPINAGPVMKFHEPIGPMDFRVDDSGPTDELIKIHTLEEAWMAHPSRSHYERWWKFGTTLFKPREPALRPMMHPPEGHPAYRY